MFGHDEAHQLVGVARKLAQLPRHDVCRIRGCLGLQNLLVADARQEIPESTLFSDLDIPRGIVELYLGQQYS